MKKNIYGLIALSLILTLSLSSFLPIAAQNFDIVSGGGDDIEGGSSVFVFRKSRKAPQTQTASRSSGRSQREKIATRQSVAAKSKARPKPVARKIDPEALAILQKKPVSKPISKPPKPVPGKTPKPIPATDETAVIIPPAMTKEQRETLAETFASSADIYLNNNNTEEATRQYEKSLELNPQNELAKFGLSTINLRRANAALDAEVYEGAIPLFEQAIKYDPQNAAAFAGLGDTYDALGKKTEAKAQYEKALAVNSQLSELFYPLGVLNYDTGDFKNAENYFAKAIDENSSNAEAQNYLGMSLLKQGGRQPEAMAAFTKATQANPTFADAFHNLGDIYDQLDRRKDAAENFQKAIAIYEQMSPRPLRLAEAYYDLGVSFYNRGNYEEAATNYEKARKVNPVYYEALTNLADTYRQLNRYNDALGIYAIAVEIGKNKPATERAEVYGKYGYCAGKAKNWNLSRILLQKATELSSDAVDYVNLGWALNNSAVEKKDANAYAEARVALEKARDLDPNFYPAYYNLGDTYNLTGEYALAVQSLTKAIDLYKKQTQNDWADAYVGRGFAYRGLGNLNNAANDLRQATKLNDKMTTAYFFLGIVENERNNTKEAQAALNRLQELNSRLAPQLDRVLKNKTIENLQKRGYKKVEAKVPKPKSPF